MNMIKLLIDSTNKLIAKAFNNTNIINSLLGSFIANKPFPLLLLIYWNNIIKYKNTNININNCITIEAGVTNKLLLSVNKPLPIVINDVLFHNIDILYITNNTDIIITSFNSLIVYSLYELYKIKLNIPINIISLIFLLFK